MKMDYFNNQNQKTINVLPNENLFSNCLANTSAAIIAGGKSSRFGTNKANACFQNNKLIDIAVQNCYKISSDVFMITSSRYKYENLLVPTISDIIPNCGPLGGIFTALVHSNNPYICTIPCDMPLLVPDLFRLLFKKRSDNRPVVARSENGIEPLLSLWPTGLVSSLYSYIKDGKYNLRYILTELQAIEINIPLLMKNYNPNIFTNVNYKKDLEKINRMSYISVNKVHNEMEGIL